MGIDGFGMGRGCGWVQALLQSSRWKSTGVHGTLMLAVKRQYEVPWYIDPGGLDDN